MVERSSRHWLVAACLVVLCFSVASSVSAQITTGTVYGTVKDSTGAVVPGATVVLISETKGTKSQPQITNEVGEYVFPYITGDTYTVEVSLTGFKTVQQKEIKVSGADRVTVPTATLAPGGASETITVAATTPLIQASSGERSFAVSTQQIENLPINHSNFTDVVYLTPGVIPGANLQNSARIGAVGQNNIMMDGASAMDTGNNGQMLEHEHRVDRRSEGPDVGLPGRVRPVERLADHGRHQEWIESVSRIRLHDPRRLHVERQHLGQRQERRSQAAVVQQHLRVFHRRSGGQAGPQQQALLLLRA